MILERPERGALLGGLDRHGVAADRLAHQIERTGGAHLLDRLGREGHPRRRRNALGEEEPLREVLVPREHAREHARAGVGDLEELEQLLDHAVLAELAVQRDVDRVRPLGAQRVDELGDEVEREHAVAARLEGRDDACPRLQRYVALERAPAHENRDLVRHAPILSPYAGRHAAPSSRTVYPRPSARFCPFC